MQQRSSRRASRLTETPSSSWVRLGDAFFGRRLASQESADTKIGPWGGIPVLGLDGLSSAAYGPEAALTILVPLGAAGLSVMVPLFAVICVLLLVVYLSYLQTLSAYPDGGGSYTVAKENLGERAGLAAASALLVDYVLNVAVGISAGVAALVSVFPALQTYSVFFCLLILAGIAIVNLRGVRESETAFGLPTYLFILCLLMVLGIGCFHALRASGQPVPLVMPAGLPAAAPQTFGFMSFWLWMRAFAAGCSAMTGVEAVSNGIGAFREPRVLNAKRTLTAIVLVLAVLLVGIAYLCKVYGIGATNQTEIGYQSVLSQLVAAVVGRGPLYNLTLACVFSVLALSANTSFSGFPRLCQILAEDDFLPHAFGNLGRRLVYSSGIYILTLLSALLLIGFHGITDRLVPLFALSAFVAFTLSQAGMVNHWKSQQNLTSNLALVINALGACCTAVAALTITVSKFLEGTWIVVVIIPALVIVCLRIRAHYREVEQEIDCSRPINLRPGADLLVVLPVYGWNTITEKALRFGMKLSPEVIAVTVGTSQAACDELRRQWEFCVEVPLQAAGLPIPHFKVLESPYRLLFDPLLDYIESLKTAYPDHRIAVLVPELVENHWYEYFLHTQSSLVLSAALSRRADQRLIVMTVPWYLGDD